MGSEMGSCRQGTCWGWCDGVWEVEPSPQPCFLPSRNEELGGGGSARETPRSLHTMPAAMLSDTGWTTAPWAQELSAAVAQ